jgi:hypothetical protein
MTITRGLLYFAQEEVRTMWVMEPAFHPSVGALQRATGHWSWMCLLLIQTPVPKNVGRSSLRHVRPERALGPLFRNSEVESWDYAL